MGPPTKACGTLNCTVQPDLFECLTSFKKPLFMFPRLSQFTEGKAMIEFNFFSLTDCYYYYLFFSRAALFKCFAELFNARRRKKESAGSCVINGAGEVKGCSETSHHSDCWILAWCRVHGIGSEKKQERNRVVL